MNNITVQNNMAILIDTEKAFITSKYTFMINTFQPDEEHQ